MISLESKTQTSTPSSPLNLAPTQEGAQPTLSFSELLRGASVKNDEKSIQNGVLVLALDEDASKDAKEYLKKKIVSSEGFKKSEIEALPKTLKGLAQVASKLGLNLNKVSLEEVKGTVAKVQSTLQLEVDETDTLDKKLKVQDSVDVDLDVEIKKSAKRVQTQLKPQVGQETPKEITTEQLVNTKINTIEANTPKKKGDETLNLLLRGEKHVKSESGFTADFSVATARVLAPEATTNASKSLESLLRGETTENQQTSKLDGLNIAKADSFEIKLNEAKQMTKYLSADVKTAIEDYKSPFTRVKVELNPQRLGLVELTVVQRGKNLHINLSSNNAAINALALNANDLKVQLSNNGINNASLNFNNNSQSSEQGSFGQQQHNSQHEKEAREEYNYLQSEEQNEEILNSLEIVVPHYA